MSEHRRGPAERYVRNYALARHHRGEGWNRMEQALVMTLIDWKCDSELAAVKRPRVGLQRPDGHRSRTADRAVPG